MSNIEYFCHYCQYKFEPRVPYPRRCPNRECQKMWPLGKPQKYTFKKVRSYWKEHAGKKGVPMFCPQCGKMCRKLWEDLAERAVFLCESCALEWLYGPAGYGSDTPTYFLERKWSKKDLQILRHNDSSNTPKVSVDLD